MRVQPSDVPGAEASRGPWRISPSKEPGKAHHSIPSRHSHSAARSPRLPFARQAHGHGHRCTLAWQQDRKATRGMRARVP